MRIYQMTATFGKLEHETLTLKPGLNVITAPNEWGKSTWCAFLVAMLYGLDTRAKTTKNALADKERYAPWSGSPMSGRIDLRWNGKDITIERSTRRRVPLGEFKAYETDTGIPVTELTAANCGQMLLGVEQSVFRRAGFIRHADLPVTQDEALRRRLNALVTSGDESGDADKLADQLKELKNRCRYNRSGLLPQAEAERDALEAKITELENLQVQSEKLGLRADEMERMISQLKNHLQALAYEKSQADAARVAEAEKHRDQTAKQLQNREAECTDLPSAQRAEDILQQLYVLRQQLQDLTEEEKQLPQEPVAPQPEPMFAEMSLEEAADMVRKDMETYRLAAGTKAPNLLIIVGILGLAISGLLVFLRAYLYAAIAGAAAAIMLVWGVYEKITLRKKVGALIKKYGSDNEKRWLLPLREYERNQNAYQTMLQEYRVLHQDFAIRKAAATRKQESLCGDGSVEDTLEQWLRISALWEAQSAARKEGEYAQRHYEVLRSMYKPVEKPAEPDHLNHSEQETQQLLAECTAEQKRLHSRLGQYRGQMEALGAMDTLCKQRDRQLRRIAKLEDTYAALTIAQQTLAEARAELQRRFAPRITKRAQKLMYKMTGGRYNGMTMGQDFSLQARAGEEDVLHDAIWRSDGTMDQLYLALRLAVAEELTPNAPLVLDDALVRFDDRRMAATVDVLREMASKRQIICFTCQGREGEVS